MVIKYNESDKNLKSSRVIERWFTDEGLKCYAILEAFDYDKARDTHCNKRNRVMKMPDSGENKGEENKMKKTCVRCGAPLSGRQRKLCSKKCSGKKKEVAKPRSSHQPVTDERRQMVQDFADGKVELSKEERQALWWDLSSYRQLFGDDQ